MKCFVGALLLIAVAQEDHAGVELVHDHDHHDHEHGHHHEHGESFVGSVRDAFVDSVPWLILGLVVSGALEAVMPSQKTLAGFMGGGGALDVVKGAVAGVCVPLCSCGALPVAVLLCEAGASSRAVVAFITAAQSAGLDSAMITYGTLGPEVACWRIGAALAIAVAAGLAAPAARPEMKKACCEAGHEVQRGFLGRVAHGVYGALTDTFDEVAPWVAVGLVVTAAVTSTKPSAEMKALLGEHSGARVLVLAGTLPLQLCEHGTVIFAGALRRAGASPGTAFAFLVSAPATNLATMALLLQRQPAGSWGVLRVAVAISLAALALSYAFDLSGARFQAGVAGHDLPEWLAAGSLYLAAVMVAGSGFRFAARRLGGPRSGAECVAFAKTL